MDEHEMDIFTNGKGVFFHKIDHAIDWEKALKFLFEMIITNMKDWIEYNICQDYFEFLSSCPLANAVPQFFFPFLFIYSY